MCVCVSNMSKASAGAAGSMHRSLRKQGDEFKREKKRKKKIAATDSFDCFPFASNSVDIRHGGEEPLVHLLNFLCCSRPIHSRLGWFSWNVVEDAVLRFSGGGEKNDYEMISETRPYLSWIGNRASTFPVDGRLSMLFIRFVLRYVGPCRWTM